MDELAAIVQKHVEALVPGSECIVVGSYRRGASTCGDIDFLIFPPVQDPALAGSAMSTGSGNNSGSSSSNVGSSGSSGKYLYLPDLLIALENIGFLTHHLSYPHTPSANSNSNVTANGVGSPGSASGRHSQFRHNNGDDSNSDQDDNDQATRPITHLKHHLKYLGVCKLDRPGAIYRRIDIWVSTVEWSCIF